VPMVSGAQRSTWDETEWVWNEGYGRQDKPQFHVVAVDYGIKRNILRLLANVGARVTVVPAKTSAEDIFALKPDGIFLSNGPGDPAATGEYAVPAIRSPIGDDVLRDAAGRPAQKSMPADSVTLADEGVVIEPRVLDDAAIAEISEQMRRPDQRRADLRAQLAAGRVGALRLTELYERVGADALTEAYAEVLDYAERRTRACINDLPDGEYTAEDVLEAREGDLPITVRARVSAETLFLL